MTARYEALTVALEHDVREDDAEALIKAIEMMRGVLAVTGIVPDIGQFVARERIRLELGRKLMRVLYPEREKDNSSR